MAEARKAIFITGAASGMGRETARLFHEKGWFLGAYDVDEAGLAALKAELGETAGLFARLDVSDRAAYLAAVDAFGQATAGRLDILFNNAGIGRGGFFDEQPWEDVVAVVSVNLMGVLIGIHAATPLLKATPGSLCFTTSSSSATFGMANIAVYSATKHAVKGLTEALSIEFARFGVRAADTLPGLIDTAILPDTAKARAAPDGMWRLVHPRAIAEVVWRAYHEDKVHWYVPEELEGFDLAATQDPRAVRDQMIGGAGLKFGEDAG